MQTHHPFPAERLRALRQGLAQGVGQDFGQGVSGSLDALAALRRTLSGAALPLTGLRALCAAEPDLAARLHARILPALLRHAQARVEAEEPVLTVHAAGQPAHTRIPRAEAAGWIAHMFLGTLQPPSSDFPHADFAPLLEARRPAERAKLRCILAYFDRIADAPPPGHLAIERIALPPRTAADWIADPAALLPLTHDPRAAIEDSPAHRQVDFANRYLGGGVLSGGCVQEEIRFAVSPELLFGLLVSPRMRAEEAIVLRGTERFARTDGYGGSLRYGGPLADPCARAADGTPDSELVAIDALDYRRRDTGSQHTADDVLRELNKARSGFARDPRALPVATGNWGCGVFGGDPALKAVIQWLAASAEGRAVHYLSFGDGRVGDLVAFARAARAGIGTVGAAAARLLAACTQGGGPALYARMLAG